MLSPIHSPPTSPTSDIPPAISINLGRELTLAQIQKVALTVLHYSIRIMQGFTLAFPVVLFAWSHIPYLRAIKISKIILWIIGAQILNTIAVIKWKPTLTRSLLTANRNTSFLGRLYNELSTQEGIAAKPFPKSLIPFYHSPLFVPKETIREHLDSIDYNAAEEAYQRFNEPDILPKKPLPTDPAYFDMLKEYRREEQLVHNFILVRFVPDLLSVALKSLIRDCRLLPEGFPGPKQVPFGAWEKLVENETQEARKQKEGIFWINIGDDPEFNATKKRPLILVQYENCTFKLSYKEFLDFIRKSHADNLDFKAFKEKFVDKIYEPFGQV
ncbi:MAG: hypothetical protein ACOYL1_04875 [Chlamydiia bacterium]